MKLKGWNKKMNNMELHEIETKIKELKIQKKILKDEQYSFNLLYKKLAGHDNILKNLKYENLSDTIKVNKAIKILKEFIVNFEN